MNQIIEACESKTNSMPEFPMGWYSVARSGELQAGEVKRVYALDRELALYRTENGVPVLQDAFCPHLGAHLGVQGKVVGESLQCPFHGWRFDRTGNCVEIPYCEEIPERARIRMWPTEEKNGEIYIWFHPENTAPQWEIPDFVELGDENWTSPRFEEFEVAGHIQDIAENSCDPVHFEYVHLQPGVPPSTVTVDDDGRTMHLHSDIDLQSHPHHLHSTMFQPGLAFVRSTFGPNAEMVVYNSALPITRQKTLLRWSLTVRREIDQLLAGVNPMDGIIAGIKQDHPIWANKVHKHRPVFCREDKTLVLYRKWVRQFYIDGEAVS